MKKIFSFVALGMLLGGALFVVTAFAHAAGLGDATGNLNKAVGNLGLAPKLEDTIGTIVRAALALVGTVFLILTIYAGILWMTAQGAEEQIEKAQKIIKATIIGLFITVSAYAITFFVTDRLSKTGGNGGGAAPTTQAGESPAGGGISEADCAKQGGECRSAADDCNPDGVGASDPYDGSNLGVCGSSKTVECCVLKDSDKKCGNMGGVCLKSCAQGQQELGSCDKLTCCK